LEGQHVRENAPEGSQKHFQQRFIEPVEMDPLCEDAARPQAAFADFQKLAREELGWPREPGVRRLRDDDLILLALTKQGCARIVNDHSQAWISERIVIELGKEARGL